MRATLALAVPLLVAGALVFSGGATAHRHGATHTRASAAYFAKAPPLCSGGIDCARGCTLPVATSAPEPSAAAPCAARPNTVCREYVAARPEPGSSARCGASPTFAERLVAPQREESLRSRARKLLAPRAKQSLRSLQKSHRSAAGKR